MPKPIRPTPHCQHCTGVVYRWRGRAYLTQQSAEADRRAEKTRDAFLDKLSDAMSGEYQRFDGPQPRTPRRLADVLVSLDDVRSGRYE